MPNSLDDYMGSVANSEGTVYNQVPLPLRRSSPSLPRRNPPRPDSPATYPSPACRHPPAPPCQPPSLCCLRPTPPLDDYMGSVANLEGTVYNQVSIRPLYPLSSERSIAAMHLAVLGGCDHEEGRWSRIRAGPRVAGARARPTCT